MSQPQARRLHASRPRAAGLRWWSTYESLWIHVTLFDRAAGQLRVRDVRALTVEYPAVVEAAQRFDMRS